MKTVNIIERAWLIVCVGLPLLLLVGATEKGCEPQKAEQEPPAITVESYPTAVGNPDVWIVTDVKTGSRFMCVSHGQGCGIALIPHQ